MSKDPYVFEPHSFKGRIVGKSYCTRCGLVHSNNDFTQWSIKHGCNSDDHPNFESMRRRSGYGEKAYLAKK